MKRFREGSERVQRRFRGFKVQRFKVQRFKVQGFKVQRFKRFREGSRFRRNHRHQGPPRRPVIRPLCNGR